MEFSLKPEYSLNHKAGYIFFGLPKNDFVRNGQTDELEPSSMSYEIADTGICINEHEGIKATMDQGVIYCNLNNLFNDNNRIIIFKKPFKLEEFGPERLISIAKSHVGSKYDLKLFIGNKIANLFLRVSERIRLEILRFFNIKNRVISSEFVMKCLINGNYANTENVQITPRELFFHQSLKKPDEIFPVNYRPLIILANRLTGV